jgi:hypothetical protein
VGSLNLTLQQQIYHEKGLNYWKGRTITFGCWVWCDTASSARLSYYDGVVQAFSSYHTGGSGWEWLSFTFTVHTSATELRVLLYNVVNTSTAWFDGAIAVEGATAFAFSKRPNDLDIFDVTTSTPSYVGQQVYDSNFKIFIGSQTATCNWVSQ